MTSLTPTFPGGTSVSWLRVYESLADDGHAGGSPHVHLASAECYVVLSGSGSLQTLDTGGFKDTALSPGRVLWFTPGTIHRAVNSDRLEVLVIMQNAGLPEAGDAVLTFPDEILADPTAYADAATLPAPGSADLAERARRRRDLAVTGFVQLCKAVDAGNSDALLRFYHRAVELRHHLAPGWADLVRSTAAAQVTRTGEQLAAIGNGSITHLLEGRLHHAPTEGPAPTFGMCGTLARYDVSGAGLLNHPGVPGDS